MPNDQIINPAFNAVQPGAYSLVDASALTDGAGQPAAPVVAVLATALGGAPNKPLYFRSAAQAKQLLRAGSIAYDLVRFAFAAGASRVCVVRVGNAPTQSTLALAGTGTMATLTSIDYGSWTTGIKVQVKASNVIVITYTDPSGNLFTETFDLSAITTPTAAQVAAAINGTLAGYTASRLVTAVAGVGTAPLTVLSATALAGGTDGLIPIAGDWTSGLAALEPEEVDLVLVGTGDATVHAQAQTHCVNMSATGARRERFLVAGGVLGETVTTVAARMTTLNQRTELVYPGVYDFDLNGNQVLYDPFYLAAKIAGMHAAVDQATALTHKRVPVLDVESRLSTVQGGALDTLLLAGVSPVAPAPGGGFWLVDSLTGYKAADRVFLDVHKVRSADYVQKVARVQLEGRFVGTKGLNGSSAAIQSVAAQVLSDLKSQQIIRGYLAPVVTPGSNPNAYLVSLPVMLVDTVKFIYLTVALQPSSTVNRDTGFTAADSLS